MMKIGDRVKLLDNIYDAFSDDDEEWYTPGSLGTVTEVHTKSGFVRVELDKAPEGEHSFAYYPHELALA